jgi:phosphoadenosine phosphosulfate reductase
LTSFQHSSYHIFMNNHFLERLESSKQLVKKALSEHEDPIVACSFGKDSMAVLHLVRQFKPDVKVLWNNTLVEYPDTYQFARCITKEWNLHVYEAKPQKTFWQIVSELGWPIYPRDTAGKQQEPTRHCCKELKKLPTLRLLRRYKWDLYFTGLTRHESRLREFSARRYGDYFYSKEWKIWKCHPILDWTTEDVWEYHREFDLPYNPLYDKNEVAIRGGIRTGCWPCPQAIRYGKLQHLRFYYPRLFQLLVVQHELGKEILNLRLQRAKGLDVARITTYLDVGLDKALHARPCLFDRL